ncbi:hypothetical protein [uncultured Draconibacterium sp.]|uniref:hypothetical protein n=1 Tax=uncultured Draconibacterium sp. TaxID=1573823 RepID=UPI0025D0ACC1|nr:hypothetical protein [uncultured Draconibacterium sp.]
MNLLYKRSGKMIGYIFLALFSLSCAKLPVYHSQDLSGKPSPDFSTIPTNHFDEKNNIRYGVAVNDTNFFFTATLSDRNSYPRIMRGGLNLYFDPQGKKSKKYALKIERSTDQLNRQNLQGRPTQEPGMNGNMAAAINSTLKKVTWDANGEEFTFFRSPHLYAIEVNFTSNEYNELVLELQMPLKEIPVAGDRTFSAGLETGSSVPTVKGSGSMSNYSGSGRGRGSGGGMGGMSGGVGRGGGRGGQMKGMQQHPTGASSSAAISSWFKVAL